MKNIMKYILILIILVIIFIILNFYKSNKIIFEDIMILGLWNDIGAKNEYEISSQKTVKIDIFTTINNKMYKKIAPGCKGCFVIKFKRPSNTNYSIKIKEKTSKPQNLVFILENKKYNSIKEMENIINEKFVNTDEITINWEWEYYVNDIQDIQDTIEGENAQSYLFEIKAIIEDAERIGK
ncbi:MAG: hypothetical protein IJE68_05205 [Clostridia bacterium]|nr:hypothetical protein [Clostridia bacterium]